jgi:glycosyltransferase involved in cell wall biosynthesis
MSLRQRMTWLNSTRFVMKLSKVAAAMTVASERERARLIEAECDPARIAVVPNGADEADLDAVAAVESRSLIYPGSIEYRPNFDAVHELIADILPRLRRTHPGVTLRVTGDAGEERIGMLGAFDRVVFTGRVGDVRPLIAQSAVCVVPLRSGGGTRTKILQALALGTPVVSTTKGAEGLAVVDGETIVVADSADAFAGAIGRLLDDGAWRARLSARGRKLIRDSYTWTRAADALETVILRAAGAVHG